MRYQKVTPILRQEVKSSLNSGLPDKICDALVRVTFYDPDWQWVQGLCLDLAQHINSDVRGIALTCLGHLARIHKTLDIEKVLPILRESLNDPEVSARAGDALDDIKTFLHVDLGNV